MNSIAPGTRTTETSPTFDQSSLNTSVTIGRPKTDVAAVAAYIKGEYSDELRILSDKGQTVASVLNGTTPFPAGHFAVIFDESGKHEHLLQREVRQSTSIGQQTVVFLPDTVANRFNVGTLLAQTEEIKNAIGLNNRREVHDFLVSPRERDLQIRKWERTITLRANHAVCDGVDELQSRAKS